jgi:hypothetical protein
MSVDHSDELKNQPSRVVKGGRPDSNAIRIVGGVLTLALLSGFFAWVFGAFSA